MLKKIYKIFLAAFMLLGGGLNLASCDFSGIPTTSATDTPVTGTTDEPVISTTDVTKENQVKIKSISAEAQEEEVISPVALRNAKSLQVGVKNENNDTAALSDEEGNPINYILIYKSQTEITFTVTLDNPEAYGIDALRVTCDDPDSQIMVDGEYKNIRLENDGSRVINWSSEDPYTKTYNIRTTSQESINTFKVVDVRLAGHDKFQSKETNSEDLGNNELQIYKMDEDAIKLNIVDISLDYIKFNFNIKEGYEGVISNITVSELDKKTMTVDENEVEYWETSSDLKDLTVSYEYKTKFGSVNNAFNINVSPIMIRNLEENSRRLIDNELDGIGSDWEYNFELMKYETSLVICASIGYLGKEDIDFYFDGKKIEILKIVSYELDECTSMPLCRIYLEDPDTSASIMNYQLIKRTPKDSYDKTNISAMEKVTFKVLDREYKFTYEIHESKSYGYPNILNEEGQRIGFENYLKFLVPTGIVEVY